MIPLTRPRLGDEEARAVEAVLRSGQLVSGEWVERFERGVAERCDRRHGIAVSSGTAALHLALRAVGVGPGHEVLVPDLTWPSPAHAVLMCGAEPVLVDVDLQEWNAGAEHLAAAVSTRTRAAVVVDQFGNPVQRAAIERALGELPIVEDAACALGSAFADGPCGSMGAISCFSFHPRKVLTTGEGGMCVTDDDALASRLRALRNHGQRSRGVFVEASANHRLSEISAAVGAIQLERLDSVLAARRQRAARYVERLPWLQRQLAPEGAEPNAQTFGVLLPETTSAAGRAAVVRALNERGIEAGPLSYALHRVSTLRRAAEAAQTSGRDFQHAEAIVDRGIALPLYPDMTDDEQDAVIQALREVLQGVG